MEYVDFSGLRRSGEIDLVFPAWKKGERVAFFSPHDDDAVLGAGCLILATVRSGGTPDICVFCCGDAGYSTLPEKREIVQQRRREAIRAYRSLGVNKSNIRFFGLPDFSLSSHLDRRARRTPGLFDRIVSFLRGKRISRVLFSSGFLEHWDHTAVFHAGLYISPQAQDPILADLGKPQPIRSYLAFSVWGDFEPAQDGRSTRADRGILASQEDEDLVLSAITEFSSQARIIEEIVARRKKRKTNGGYLELYKSYEPRKPIDYPPYFQLLKKMK